MATKHITTRCIHAGSEHVQHKEGLNTPLYPSSAYGYQNGVVYPRYYNTTNQKVLGAKMASLEGTEDALVLSSGMAAISSALYSFLQKGDHALFANQLYGGTLNLLREDFRRRGIDFNQVNFSNLEEVKQAIRPETKLLYFETPSNPLLQIADMEAISNLAGNHLLTIVDNTFASPVNQTPATYGVDIILHSGTKYLGGHSDMTFGVVAGQEAHINKIRQTAKLFGGNINTMDAYLIERSLKTLAIRVQRQNENAGALARFLKSHQAVKEVHYPGLPHHPGYNTAMRQMMGFGGMLSFSLHNNTKAAADNFLKSLKLIQPAISLGGIETIISAPADTSHAALSPEERRNLGIAESLLRLSAGIEQEEDLIADLEHALQS